MYLPYTFIELCWPILMALQSAVAVVWESWPSILCLMLRPSMGGYSLAVPCHQEYTLIICSHTYIVPLAQAQSRSPENYGTRT
jgi:hypothetical protein